MGVLSDKEEEDGEGRGGRNRREVFLCIKQGLVLEVDMQRGRERCRLELNSLARVETTEAAWTRGVRAGVWGCNGSLINPLLKVYAEWKHPHVLKKRRSALL